MRLTPRWRRAKIVLWVVVIYGVLGFELAHMLLGVPGAS